MNIKGFIYSILLIMGSLMASCDKHEDLIDYTLKVGNIYCMDGTIVPPGEFPDMGKQAVGVVVRVGEKEEDYQAIVVGLRDIGMAAYADTLYTIRSVSSDITLFNGKHNTAALMNEYTGEERLNPGAAIKCTNYTCGNISGWHLPSVAEVKAAGNGTVRRSIEIAGGATFKEDWYMTSTIDGSSEETTVNYNFCINMAEGRVVSSYKTEAHLVRPFLVIR